MTPDFFRRVEEVFNAARELRGAAREALLRRECGGDAALLEEVQALLGHDQEPQEYLRTPALGAALQVITAGGTRRGIAAHPAPERIGRYRVIRPIGEGGFGVVYLAEQDNPRRTVAVKIVKPHLATPAMLRRFEYEAQVLGRLQHPGIAQIHEAGVVDGQAIGVRQIAFFAMEYVAGTPLDVLLRKRDLPLGEKLELVAKVCDAVQYAHQRGIIHRDLKPGNILVVEPAPEPAGDGPRPAGPAASNSGLLRRAGGWSPKILDFGVARTTDDSQPLTTMGTSIGQLIGTLPYMSPEQAVGNPSEIDTRSDVYSLGVILYQVLSGNLPHDFRSCAVPEAARRIREETPRRLGTLDRAYRGEIEIIVAKALEKDRARRYQSAADLACELRRFMAGEPIEARRDSALYVLRKTLRRYRGYAIFALGFATLLITSAVGAVLQARANAELAERETAARRDAQAALEAAQRAKRIAEARLRQSNIERGRLLGMAGNLAAAEPLLWEEYFKQPRARHAHWALWELYLRQPSLLQLPIPPGKVAALAFTPDGAYLLSAGLDGYLRLWDTRTARLSAESYVEQTVHNLALTPDGRVAVLALFGGGVCWWDVAAWREIRRVQAHYSVISGVACSADGRWTVTAGNDSYLSLWESATGARVLDICIGRNAPRQVALTADNRLLCAGGVDSTIQVWYIDHDGEGRPLAALPFAQLAGHSGPVNSIALRPDGRALLSGGRDRTVREWDLASGESALLPELGTGAVREVLYADDGATLVVGSAWSVELVAASNYQRRPSLATPAGVTALADCGDGRLATGMDDFIRIWETRPRSAFEHLGIAEPRMQSVDVSADGARLYFLGADERLHQRSLAAPRDLASTPTLDSPLNIVVAPDGRRALVSSRRRELALLDLEHGTRLALYQNSPSGGRVFDFRPGGPEFAGGRDDGAVVIRDARSGAALRTFPRTGLESVWLRYAPGGAQFASVTREPRVRVRDAQTGADLAVLPCQGGGQPWCVAFSPDGALLAVGAWHRGIELWDWRAGRRLSLLEGHTQLVSDVAFLATADGPLLISSSNDGTLKLWDPEEGRCLATLDAGAGDAYCVRPVPRSAAERAAGRLGSVLAVYGQGGIGQWNLDYYDRHIAGNALPQVSRLAQQRGAEFDAAAATAVAERLLGEHWRSRP